MIDSVIFDIGNVLLKFDYQIAARRLMELNGLAEPPDRGRVVAAKTALEAGRIDRAEFLRRVKPEFRHAGSDESFLAIWEDIFEENAPMTRLAKELAASGVPTFLLSNMSCIHHDFIFRAYPVFRTFRDGVFSYKAGSLKPDAAIYRVAIGQFGIDPSRAVFLDDLEANIAGAEAQGLSGIVYDWRRHGEAEERLRELLASR